MIADDLMQQQFWSSMLNDRSRKRNRKKSSVTVKKKKILDTNIKNSDSKYCCFTVAFISKLLSTGVTCLG